MSRSIKASGVSKRYVLGGSGAQYGRLSESIYRALRSPLKARRDARADRTFWALRDVDFSVDEGEALGIIGRNGAGKSTLLKILSRITMPTKGRVELRGRVGSLLEVGTGFHPELSGRENIFVNGAILGMKKSEIVASFDEIVAFAEVERFLDTPVKRYSSGMYVRLAFAVAAHLRPEILVVDEVLAVGDVAFQRKCLGKMDDVSHEGRTVIFVSHNTTAILSLCSRVLLLDRGELVGDGAPAEIVNRYLAAAMNQEQVPLVDRQDRTGDGTYRITSLTIEDLRPGHPISTTSELRVSIGYEGSAPLRQPRFLIAFYDYSNTGLFLLDSEAAGGIPDVLPPVGTVSCTTDVIRTTAGRVFVNVALEHSGSMADYIQYAAEINVEAADSHGTGRAPPREWVVSVIPQTWGTE